MLQAIFGVNHTNMNTFRTSPFKRNETITNETFVQHVYDLDMIKIYNDFSIALSHKEKVSSKINTDEFLENIREKIMNYCAKNDFNYSYHLSAGNIIVNSDNPQYHYFLGLRLITCKEYDVSRILDYQNEQFTNESDSFINLLKHRVTQVIENHSNPADAVTKIKLLDNWIKEQNREKILLKEISKISLERKSLVAEISKQLHVADGDKRVVITGVEPEVIRNFFTPLTTNNNINGDLFMQQDELEYFLGFNFQGFDRPKEHRILNPNMKQVQIRVYLAHFYKRYCEGKIPPMQFALILQNTFKRFEGSTLPTIKKNLVKDMSSQDYLFKKILP